MEMEQGSLFERPEPAGRGDFASIDEVRAAEKGCVRCDLSTTRQQVVPGEGPATARLMIVGEGPSEADDSSGRPFSGPSGRVLAGWLAALGLRRDEVWLTNVVRCRPATVERGRLKNRPPTAREANACRIWLSNEIAFVRPEVILGLGGTAGKALVGKDFKITQQRGQWFEGPNGIPTLIAFHPAYLLRLEEPALSQVQATVDADLAAVRARLTTP